MSILSSANHAPSAYPRTRLYLTGTALLMAIVATNGLMLILSILVLVIACAIGIRQGDT